MGIYYKSTLQKTDLLSEHILELKTDIEFAKPIGIAMSITVKELYPELLNSDLLVPIASHPDEIADRGYNQALELAKVLRNDLDIEVADVLMKTRSEKLPKRGWWERKQAVRGLYQMKEASAQIIGKKILLVDDVVTTGATCSECATLLKSAGALSVRVITAGRTIYTKEQT
jgi:predicted amidophosphoribosyltransferase